MNELSENNHKKHGGQDYAGIIHNGQNRRGVVVAVHVRSQNLGTDERSDHRPLRRGKAALEKILTNILPEQINAESAPHDGYGIRNQKSSEQQSRGVDGKMCLHINGKPVHTESVQARNWDNQEKSRKEVFCREHFRLYLQINQIGELGDQQQKTKGYCAKGAESCYICNIRILRHCGHPCAYQADEAERECVK